MPEIPEESEVGSEEQLPSLAIIPKNPEESNEKYEERLTRIFKNSAITYDARLRVVEGAYRKRKAALKNAYISQHARERALYIGEPNSDEATDYLEWNTVPFSWSGRPTRRECINNIVRYKIQGNGIKFDNLARPILSRDIDELMEKSNEAHQTYIEWNIQQLKIKRNWLKDKAAINRVLKGLKGFKITSEEISEYLASSKKRQEELEADFKGAKYGLRTDFQVYKSALRHIAEFKKNGNFRKMGIYKEDGTRIGFYTCRDINELLTRASIFKEHCIELAKYFERSRILMLPEEELHSEIDRLSKLSDGEREEELFKIAGVNGYKVTEEEIAEAMIESQKQEEAQIAKEKAFHAGIRSFTPDQVGLRAQETMTQPTSGTQQNVSMYNNYQAGIRHAGDVQYRNAAQFNASNSASIARTAALSMQRNSHAVPAYMPHSRPTFSHHHGRKW